MQGLLSWWNSTWTWHGRCCIALVPKLVRLSFLGQHVALWASYLFIDGFLQTATSIFFGKTKILKPLTYFITLWHSSSSRNPTFNKTFDQMFKKENTVQCTACAALSWAVIIHQWRHFTCFCVLFVLRYTQHRNSNLSLFSLPFAILCSPWLQYSRILIMSCAQFFPYHTNRSIRYWGDGPGSPLM